MTRSRMLLLLPVFWLPALWANQAVGQLTGVVLHTPPLWADYFVCSVVTAARRIGWLQQRFSTRTDSQ